MYYKKIKRVMCKRTHLLVSALLVSGFTGVVFAGENKSSDPLSIPWPNCGAGSDAKLPCQEDIRIERDVTGVVEEIAEEDLDGFSDFEGKGVLLEPFGSGPE